jgi:hypothetical protein
MVGASHTGCNPTTTVQFPRHPHHTTTYKYEVVVGVCLMALLLTTPHPTCGGGGRWGRVSGVVAPCRNIVFRTKTHTEGETNSRRPILSHALQRFSGLSDECGFIQHLQVLFEYQRGQIS